MTSMIAAIGEVGIFVVIAGIFLYTAHRNIQSQNKKFDLMFEKLIDTEHNEAKEDRAFYIDKEINAAIEELRVKTGAGRVSFFRFHNGGHDLQGASFLKMSMTNEAVGYGIKPRQCDFVGQFRSMFPWAMDNIHTKGEIYVEDIETLKNADTSLYLLLKEAGAVKFAAMKVENERGKVVGVLSVECFDEKCGLGRKDTRDCLISARVRVETVYRLAREK